jgi:hypothetical protein
MNQSTAILSPMIAPRLDGIVSYSTIPLFVTPARLP